MNQSQFHFYRMPDDWQLEHWQIVLYTVAFAAHHYCPGLTYQRVTLGFVRHDCREPQRASLVYVSGCFKPHSWLRLSCGLKERITDSGPCFSSFCMPPAGWHRRSCEWRPRATTPPRAYRVAVSTVLLQRRRAQVQPACMHGHRTV